MPDPAKNPELAGLEACAETLRKSIDQRKEREKTAPADEVKEVARVREGEEKRLAEIEARMAEIQKPKK